MSTGKLSLNDFTEVSVETLLEVKGASMGANPCGGGGKRGSGHRAARNAEQRASGKGEGIPVGFIAKQGVKQGINAISKGMGTLVFALLGAQEAHAPAPKKPDYSGGELIAPDTSTPCLENSEFVKPTEFLEA